MKGGKTLNSFLVFKYRLRSTINTLFEFVNAGVLRLFHVGLFHTVAPLCNSLLNDVASMEMYSSWMNCPKEKCIFADLMHLFLVRFVTVRLTL